jgi:predicted TIM-barrel fold metal-dependent hydrolase
MLADAHLHLFRHGYGPASIHARLGGLSDIDAYDRLRQTHGIRAGLVIGYEADAIDPDNNRYLRELAPGREWLHSLAFRDVGASPDAAWIRNRLAEGHRGLALYVADTAAASALSGWSAEAWRSLNDHAALISLNARPEATALLAPVIAAAPDCRFLFSHVGLPGRNSAPPQGQAPHDRLRPLLALAGHNNVYVKISGLYAICDPPSLWPQQTADPFVAEVLAAFGPDRCLWGSDFSPALEFLRFDQTIPVLTGCHLTSEETAQVMGGNLVRLLDRTTGRKQVFW